MTTNNHTEFYALLRALEHLPQGWEGRICSDSKVTLCRFFVWERNQRGLWPLKNINPAWIERKNTAVARLGKRIEVVLLSGHPTIEQLKTGIGSRGTPVSIHNKWCDQRCAALAAEWKLVHGFSPPHVVDCKV